MTSVADVTGTAELGSFRAVEGAIAAWRDQLDPALLTGPVAVAETERVDVAIRQLTASKVGLAGRVEETRAFKATHRDAAGWLASSGGGSVGDANRLLRTAERLADCPRTKEAFEAGELSLTEADLVSQAVKADPSSERDLVEFAANHHNVHGLKERTDRVRRRALSAEDEAKRAAAIRASRRWNVSNDRVDGAPCIDAKFVPQDYAAANQVLMRFQQRIFEDARREGRREPETAYFADSVLAAVLAGGAFVGIESPPLSTAPGLGAFVPGSSWAPPVGPADTGNPPPADDEAMTLPGGFSRDARRPCVVVDAIALHAAMLPRARNVRSPASARSRWPGPAS